MERIGDVARARLEGGRGEPAEPPEPTEPGLPGERAEFERTGEEFADRLFPMTQSERSASEEQQRSPTRRRTSTFSKRCLKTICNGN